MGRMLIVQVVLGLWMPAIGLSLAFAGLSDNAPTIPLLAAGLAFLAAGGWLAHAAWTKLQVPDDAQRDLPPRDVDAPWTHRQDWRLPRFTREVPPVSTYYLVGAVFWTLIGWPLVLSEWRSTLSSGSFGGEDVFLLLIPAAGAGCLLTAVWPRLRSARFGPPILHLDTLPAWMGGMLQGTFRIERNANALSGDPVTVRFACYHRYVTTVEDRDGDRRNRVVKEMKWYATDDVQPRAEGAALEIPFVFDVPTGLPEATPLEERDRIVWEVRATAEVPGIDYRAAFEMPVFDPTNHDAAPSDLPSRDDASRDDASATPARTHQGPHTDAAMLNAPGADVEDIELTRSPDGRITVSFDRWRTQGGVRFAFLGGAAVSCLGIGGVLAYAGASIVGGVLGVIGLASAWAFARLWKSRSLLEVGPDEIRIANDLTGSQQDRRFATSRLSDVRIDTTGSVGSDDIYGLTLFFVETDGVQYLQEKHGVDGSVPAVLHAERTSKGNLNVTEHLDLARAVAQASRKLPVAQGLRDKAEAKWLADEILRASGVA